MLADAGLAGVAAIWGWSFILVRDAVALYPVFPFLAVRFAIATAVVGLVLANRLRLIDLPTIRGGALMGFALFTGYSFQTWGLVYTSASHSGFITGLFVIFVPIFDAALSRRWPHPLLWGAVALSTAGLGALSLSAGSLKLNFGDALTLVCAVAYSFHILITAREVKKHDTACLVTIQLACVAALSAAASPFTPVNCWPIPQTAFNAIVLTALLATAVAYFAQTAFQKRTTPTRTALIFTLEPVFAGLFAAWLGGERMGPLGLAGGASIVLGMLLGEMVSAKPDR